MRMRDEFQMRDLQALERSIRLNPASGHDTEALVKRLYRDGSLDGPAWADDELTRQFEAMWALNIELAKTIDWQAAMPSGDDAS
jgi:hypothetical protein